MTNSINNFSIIIPSYNSINTIKYTVESIQQQNPALIREVIVVDSSENDDVRNYIKSLKDKKFKIIKPGVRIMPAIQRNRGAEKAAGNILLFLDSDVILHERYLDVLLTSYKEDKKIGGGGIVLPDFQKRNKIAIAQYYLQLNEFIPCGQSRIKKCIPGCNIYCEKELFFKAGGFSEMRASEDTQFCFSANKIHDIWFIPEAKIAHIFREDSISFTTNQKMLGKYIAQNKNLPFFINNFGMIRILLPLIFLMKFCLISSRLIKAGGGHFRELLRSFNLFAKGLYYWSCGFLDGIRNVNLSKNVKSYNESF